MACLFPSLVIPNGQGPIRDPFGNTAKSTDPSHGVAAWVPGQARDDSGGVGKADPGPEFGIHAKLSPPKSPLPPRAIAHIFAGSPRLSFSSTALVPRRREFEERDP